MNYRKYAKIITLKELLISIFDNFLFLDDWNTIRKFNHPYSLLQINL